MRVEAPSIPPTCPRCGGEAEYHESSTHLWGRDYGPVWSCPRDDARTSCRPGSKVPLGTLADEELRTMRRAAHVALDSLWRRKAARDGVTRSEARTAAYQWLAVQLQIWPGPCHIGWMDLDACRATIEACRPYLLPRDAAAVDSLEALAAAAEALAPTRKNV